MSSSHDVTNKAPPFDPLYPPTLRHTKHITCHLAHRRNYSQSDPPIHCFSLRILFGKEATFPYYNASLNPGTPIRLDSASIARQAWRNVGSLGADGDIVSLTGTIATTSTNADDEIRAMCFSEAQSAVTFIDYDTNSNVNPQLTMEVWIQPTADDGSKDWLLGHDNGGYDRAIIARDSRYGGIAMGVGASYTSTVSYAAVSQWTHIVATFSKSEGVAKLYKNGGVAKGGEEQTVSIHGDSGSGETQIGLNGLKNYGGHNFVGCFARVQITNRVVEADEALSSTSPSARFRRPRGMYVHLSPPVTPRVS